MLITLLLPPLPLPLLSHRYSALILALLYLNASLLVASRLQPTERLESQYYHHLTTSTSTTIISTGKDTDKDKATGTGTPQWLRRNEETACAIMSLVLESPAAAAKITL